jgi:hypothetical protein
MKNMNLKTTLSIFLLLVSIGLWLSQPVASYAFDCQSSGSGDWTNPAIWSGCNGGYPGQTTNDFATIQSGHTVTLNGNLPHALYRLVIENGAAFDLNGNSLAFSASGGTPGLENNGSFSHNDGYVYFDDSYGTAVHDITGALTLAYVEIAGVGVAFNAAAIIDYELIIETGGYVNNIAPTYGPNSALTYRATGDYTAGAEWYANVSGGQGVPYNVTVELGWIGIDRSTLTLGAADRTLTGELLIQSSNFFAPPTGHSLFVGGGFTKSFSDFDHNGGTVVFNGSGMQYIDAGGDRIDFNNLIVAAGSSVFLPDPSWGGAVFADGTVTNNGRLSQTIYISPFETEASVVLITEDSINGNDIKFIGLDIELSGVASPHDGYDVTASIGGNQDCTTDPTSAPVQRCYDISLDPPLETGEAATVTFYYLPGEANGNPEDGLTAYRWNGTSWQPAGTTVDQSSSGDLRWVQVAGISEFSPFILDDQTPTAVTLSALSAHIPTAVPVFLLILLVILSLGVLARARV